MSWEQRAAPRPIVLVRAWIAWWLLCGVLWLWLDDTVALPELIDGAVCAAVGATAATMALARSPMRFAPRRAWLRLWWRPLVQFGTDLPVLVRVLANAATGGNRDPGAIRTVAFALETDRDARAAQIALASVAGSFAANTIVVGVDLSGGALIVHELAPAVDRSGADPLGLGT